MIESLFKEYISITKNILSGIKNGISVDEFFEKREELINSIIGLDVSSEQKRKVYISSGAEKLDNAVMEFIKNEMRSTKEQIQKATVNRKVYSSYVSNDISGSFFRRTI